MANETLLLDQVGGAGTGGQESDKVYLSLEEQAAFANIVQGCGELALSFVDGGEDGNALSVQRGDSTGSGQGGGSSGN